MAEQITDREGTTLAPRRTSQQWLEDESIRVEIELNTTDLDAATLWANMFAAARYDMRFIEARVMVGGLILLIFNKKGT